MSNYSNVIKIVDNTAYVLQTEGKFQLEAITHAVYSIREEHPNIDKFYFDFVITETISRGFGKHCRFQYAEIFMGMIEVYELSYLHNNKLKWMFNPIVRHVADDFDNSGRVLQKIDAEDNSMDFTTLDESIPYAKIRLIEF